jgi:serine/threonine-protein phosphatase 5
MSQVVASDVLWSDPSTQPGMWANQQRCVGCAFGPDVTEVRRTTSGAGCTRCQQQQRLRGVLRARATPRTPRASCRQAFLAANRLKLIVRSHEGPDARAKRPPHDRMPDISSGYALDHATPAGRLVTLFSAPEYPCVRRSCFACVGGAAFTHAGMATPSRMLAAPRHALHPPPTPDTSTAAHGVSTPPQFLPEGEARYHNRGAVLHLSAPDYATPAVESFDAVLPRPQVC